MQLITPLTDQNNKLLLPQSAQATVNFGYSGEDTDAPPVTVLAPWVMPTSILVCSASGIATVDHDPDDYIAELVSAYVTNIVSGVSFDVQAMAPNGAFGQYIFNVVGVQ